MLTTRSNICRDPGPGVIITLADVTPAMCPGIACQWAHHGHLGNNNIKCLLSLSPKTNLIIPRANKNLASNMALISPLSLSKVNTRVVATRERGTLVVFLSHVFLKESSIILRECPCPKPGLCRKYPLIIIIVSLVISWPLRVISPGSQISPSYCGRN